MSTTLFSLLLLKGCFLSHERLDDWIRDNERAGEDKFWAGDTLQRYPKPPGPRQEGGIESASEQKQVAWSPTQVPGTATLGCSTSYREPCLNRIHNSLPLQWTAFASSQQCSFSIRLLALC